MNGDEQPHRERQPPEPTIGRVIQELYLRNDLDVRTESGREQIARDIGWTHDTRLRNERHRKVLGAIITAIVAALAGGMAWPLMQHFLAR